MSHLQDTDAQSWTFKVSGFHLDAPQAAKSKVYEENDVEYDDLRASVVNGPTRTDKYVSVVEVR